MILISGGQTGVDRAALDAALTFGIPIEGMVPRDWLTERGDIPVDELRRRYPQLVESTSSKYPVRTEWNVRHSDAVLLVTDGRPGHRGTELTAAIAARLGRPHMTMTVDALEGRADALATHIETAADDFRLMIAGPRESGSPGIHDATLAALSRTFSVVAADKGMRS